MKELNFFSQTGLFLFLCFILGCNASKDSPNRAPITTDGQVFDALGDHSRIDKALDSLVDQNLVPLLYARIEAADGRTIYEHAAVNRDLYPALELDKDAWFRVWSMSKIVTISVVMDLVEDGLLKLEDPVSKYIPEFGDLKVALTANGTSITEVPWDKTDEVCPILLVAASKEMTVADLIHHKAGFYYPWTNISCLDSIWQHQDLNKAKSSQELIDLIKDMPLVQQPGSVYYYGLNTTVLGLVAERATNKSLKQLVEIRVTGPMNIQGLQYSQPPEVTLLPKTKGGDQLSKVDSTNAREILGAELPTYDSAIPMYLGGEGMLATTDGYADFARMLLHRGQLNGYRFLDDTTIAEMSSPQTELENPWGYNGYNLWVTGDTLRTLGLGEEGLWVGGGFEGTYFWIDRQRNFVGLVMTQMFKMNTSPADVFRGAVYQELWRSNL